jgi:hypothetical protein
MEKSTEETTPSLDTSKKPKWNLIVGKQGGETAPIKAEPPTQQPNRRERVI